MREKRSHARERVRGEEMKARLTQYKAFRLRSKGDTVATANQHPRFETSIARSIARCTA